jgi:hypothetical protein
MARNLWGIVDSKEKQPTSRKINLDLINSFKTSSQEALSILLSITFEAWNMLEKIYLGDNSVIKVEEIGKFNFF